MNLRNLSLSALLLVVVLVVGAYVLGFGFPISVNIEIGEDFGEAVGSVVTDNDVPTIPNFRYLQSVSDIFADGLPEENYYPKLVEPPTPLPPSCYGVMWVSEYTEYPICNYRIGVHGLIPGRCYQYEIDRNLRMLLEHIDWGKGLDTFAQESMLTEGKDQVCLDREASRGVIYDLVAVESQ